MLEKEVMQLKSQKGGKRESYFVKEENRHLRGDVSKLFGMLKKTAEYK